jgi:hypothetical protein
MAFGVYGQLKLALNNYIDSGGTGASILQPTHYFIAGAGVGFFSGIFSTPFEMVRPSSIRGEYSRLTSASYHLFIVLQVKVRMQLDNVTEQRFTGSWHCTKDILRRYGLRKLYLGYWVNTVREMAFCTIYFGVYEHMKRLLHENVMNFGNIGYLLSIQSAGGLAGMAAWFGSYPLDVVKNNVQGQSLDAQKLRMSFYHMKQRWSQGGIRTFYSGVGPSVLRAFIVSGIRFSSYEFAFSQLSNLERKLERT